MDQILLVAEIIGALSVILGLCVSVRRAIVWAKRITDGYRCQLRSDKIYAEVKTREVLT